MKPLRAATFAVAAVICVSIARAETALFLMSGPSGLRSSAVLESYVVATSDPILISQARSHLAGDQTTVLVPRAHVVSGPVEYNLNYAAASRPPWPWHVASIAEWIPVDPSAAKAQVYILNHDGAPSDVPRMLAGSDTTPAVDEMSLINYPLAMELNPGAAANMINISTRGWVEGGERVLIAGFVVKGGEPRNVVIRGVGPTLGAFGVAEPLTDPNIGVFRGSELIARNDDWKDGNLLPPPGIPERPLYAWLYPSDDREAALQLSLPPGAYTVHVAGAGSSSGVALVEVYDLDALQPR